VFSLVLVAWSVLGSTLGPILLVRLAKRPLPDWLAFVMMLSGVATVVAWGESEYSASVFKALPGMMVPLGIYSLVSATMLRRKPDPAAD
ncbi:MAG: sodium/proline symporter, partial [Polyangiales bacterium]